MKNRIAFRLITAIFCVLTTLSGFGFGQSGRQPTRPADAAGSGIRALFDEVNLYRRNKYEEFERKKIPVNENLRLQTEREQRQLAAKYAAASAKRNDLTPEDTYYLALLYWLADNYVETETTTRRFLATDDTTPERQQAARALLAVALAKQQKPEESAAVYQDYLTRQPVKISEKLRINTEIARAFLAAGRPKDAQSFALEAFEISREAFEKQASAPAALDVIFDAGLTAFEAFKADSDEESADDVLTQLRGVAARAGNTGLYFLALDKLINYKINIGKKAEALAMANAIMSSGASEMPLPGQREDVLRRLRVREKHYKMLSEPSPEITGIDRWIPGRELSLSELRGKVVLLDFWATWCSPCLAAFPRLSEWHREYSSKGLVIIGITRYYGNIGDKPATKAEEFDYLRRFREQFKLPYDLAVARDQGPHLTFGATALPTAVLIDKNGTVRVIEIGTSESRLDDLQEMILKLLAE